MAPAEGRVAKPEKRQWDWCRSTPLC